MKRVDDIDKAILDENADDLAVPAHVRHTVDTIGDTSHE
jgi:hypothetical protein